MWLVGTWMPSRLFPSAATDSLPVSNTALCKGTNIRWKHHSSHAHTYCMRARTHSLSLVSLRRKEEGTHFLEDKNFWLIDWSKWICVTFDYECWRDKPLALFSARWPSSVTVWAHRVQVLMSLNSRSWTMKKSKSKENFLKITELMFHRFKEHLSLQEVVLIIFGMRGNTYCITKFICTAFKEGHRIKRNEASTK